MEDYMKARKMYMEYLDDLSTNVIHPSIATEEKNFKKMQRQCEEYAKLKFTCQRMLLDAPRVIEGKTEVGQRVFVNIEVRDTKHVVVRLDEEMHVEMNLHDAMKVCDRKMDQLKNSMEKVQNQITKLKTDLTMLLASMDMPYTEPYKFTLPKDFPFRMRHVV